MIRFISILFIPLFSYAGIVDPDGCLQKYSIKNIGQCVGADTRVSCSNSSLRMTELGQHSGTYSLKGPCANGDLPQNIDVSFHGKYYAASLGYCKVEIRSTSDFSIKAGGKNVLRARSINEGFWAYDNTWTANKVRVVAFRYSSLLKTLKMETRSCYLTPLDFDCSFTIAKEVYRLNFNENEITVSTSSVPDEWYIAEFMEKQPEATCTYIRN